MPARFTLHGVFLSGPTYKVGLFLALARQPYGYVHVDLFKGEQKHPDFRAKQRYGQVPLLIDAQTSRRLCQSAAILEYLADATGRFAGTDANERIEAREWMYWDFDHLAHSIYRSRAIRRGFIEGVPEMLEPYAREGHRSLALLDAHLAGRAWIVGESPTIADIDIYGVIAYSDDGEFDLTPYSQIAT